MTAHPGLGSGALREALADTFQAILVAHGVYNAFDPDTVTALLNDLLAALSLSSPIEPAPPSEDTSWRWLRLRGYLRQWLTPHHFEIAMDCLDKADARPTSQASSEVREATEAAIEAFGGCLCTCDETPHRRVCNVVIATKLREALAPSRQGAGGK